MIALLRKVVDDEAALVDSLGVDALLGVKLQVAIAGGNAEERHHALGLEDAQAGCHLTIHLDVLDQ